MTLFMMEKLPRGKMMYSEKIMDELVEKMAEFLQKLELAASAVAMKEQELAKVIKGSVTMDKHFIPTSSYECAKYNHESLDPCLHCEECSVLERTLHEKCKEKELYDYIQQK